MAEVESPHRALHSFLCSLSPLSLVLSASLVPLCVLCCIPVGLAVSCHLRLDSVLLLSGVSRAVKYVNEFLATALCTQVMDVQPWHSDESLQCMAWQTNLAFLDQS